MSDPQSRRFLVVVPRTDAVGELTSDVLHVFKTDAVVHSQPDEDYHVLLQYASCRRLSHMTKTCESVLPNAKVSCTTIQTESFYTGWQRVIVPYDEGAAVPHQVNEGRSIAAKLQTLKRKRDEIEEEISVVSSSLRSYINELQSLLH